MGNSNSQGKKMGNSLSNSQSKKSSTTVLRRKSTYRSYLGHEELSPGGALAIPDEVVTEDVRRTSIERPVDVPPCFSVPDHTGASSLVVTSF